MKHVYLPTVQCPCCKFYYIIKCSHAETGSEADEVNIMYKSQEYIELKMKCKKCNGKGDYYVEIVVFDKPFLVKCEECKGTGIIKDE